MGVRDSLHDLYFRRTPGDTSLLRWLLIPLVPVYKIARGINQGWRSYNRQSLSTPVVSVGNISIGGTGKTAFVSWLCERLGEEGSHPAVLKRGQGRRKGILEPGDTGGEGGSYGDEVELLHDAHPEVPIGVGGDRYGTGREIEERFEPDLFLMDDGFQYRQLVRDLDVVLVGGNGELDQWELPAGPLREPVTALERADVISVKLQNGERDSFEQRLDDRINRREDQVVTRHRYRFEGIVTDGRDRTEQLRDTSVHLLTTLARPTRLKTFLRDNGFTIGRHLELPDHETIDPERVQRELNPDKMVVTDKEWVKLPAELRDRVGRVRSSLSVENEERVLREITVILEEST